MALALGGFLGDQLAAGRDGAVLGGVLQRIGADRLSRRGTCCAIRQPVGGLAGLDAAHEALQPLLLLVVEVGHVDGQAAARAGTRCRAYKNSRTAARQRAYSRSVASSSRRRGRASSILRISPMVAAGPLVIITTRSDSSTASSTSWVIIST